MRGDITSGTSESKAILRRQVQIEVEVEALEKLQTTSVDLLAKFRLIAERMSVNQATRRGRHRANPPLSIKFQSKCWSIWLRKCSD